MSTVNINMHPYTATTHARREVCNKITGTIGAIFVTAVASIAAQALFSSYFSIETRVYTIGAALVLCVPLIVAIAVSMYFENKMDACIELVKDDFTRLDPKLKVNEEFVTKLISKNYKIWPSLGEMQENLNVKAAYLISTFKSYLESEAVYELESAIDLFKSTPSYRNASNKKARDEAYFAFIKRALAYEIKGSEVPKSKHEILDVMEREPSIYLQLSNKFKGDRDIAFLAVQKFPIFFCAVPILTRMRPDILSAYKTGMDKLINKGGV